MIVISLPMAVAKLMDIMEQEITAMAMELETTFDPDDREALYRDIVMRQDTLLTMLFDRARRTDLEDVDTPHPLD